MLATSSTPRVTVGSRPVVLERAAWGRHTDGRLIVQRGTWCAHKGSHAGSSVIVPMVSCPNCEQVAFIDYSADAVRELVKLGFRPKNGVAIPPRYSIDRLGKVKSLGHAGASFLCGHGRCDFHRAIYLDRWQDEKPLWVVAHTMPGSSEVEFQFCHASGRTEALFHFGPLKGRKIIGVGAAVGYWTDERTGRQHA